MSEDVNEWKLGLHHGLAFNITFVLEYQPLNDMICSFSIVRSDIHFHELIVKKANMFIMNWFSIFVCKIFENKTINGI